MAAAGEGVLRCGASGSHALVTGNPMDAAAVISTAQSQFPNISTLGPAAGDLIQGGDENVALAFIALGLTAPGAGDITIGPNTYSRLTDPGIATFITGPVSGTRARIPTRWQTQKASGFNASNASDNADALLSGFSETYGLAHVIYQLSSGPGPDPFAAIALAAGR